MVCPGVTPSTAKQLERAGRRAPLHDATKVTAQRCFIGVLMDGESSTVCTTYEGHVEAIKSAGGRRATRRSMAAASATSCA